MLKLTLKEFLKTFTAIPEKFINEYYKFYELCINNKFGIPIEEVSKYLGITNLIKLNTKLREQFELNIDYIRHIRK